MMKINLLGHAAPLAAPAGGGAPAAMRQAASFFVPFVITLLLTGFFHYYWSSQVTKAQEDLEAQQRLQAELATVQRQNQVYQRELATLQLRINTIQGLQASRTGPVQLMSDLGATVDRSIDLYLMSVNPSGNALSIKGQADSVNSIANFISDLNTSGVFTNVQLQQYYEDDRGTLPSYKFELQCDYTPPGSQAAQPAAGPATPVRRPGR